MKEFNLEPKILKLIKNISDDTYLEYGPVNVSWVINTRTLIDHIIDVFELDKPTVIEYIDALADEKEASDEGI